MYSFINFILLLGFVLVYLGVFALLIWDIEYHFSDEKWASINESKTVWLLLSLFLAFPIGLLVYLLVPRQKLRAIERTEENKKLLDEAKKQAREELEEEKRIEEVENEQVSPPTTK